MSKTSGGVAKQIAFPAQRPTARGHMAPRAVDVLDPPGVHSGDDAAIDEDVGAGDEGAGGLHQEGGEIRNFARVPIRPAAELSIMRR